jgi:ribosomal protein S18 acetylase RimI-like enzyme
MVNPQHQRKGLGTILSQKAHEVIDAANGIVFVRARPGANSLFRGLGYTEVSRLEYDLGDFGAEGGKTQVFFLRRDAIGSQRDNIKGL